MNVLSERLEKVLFRIEQACVSAGRRPSEVTLVAVGKLHPAKAVQALHELGQNCFGENRLQEALAKQREIGPGGIEWHFIGPVQSNKTRDIAAHFDWVQSVDREKVLQRLSAQRPGGLRALNICLQVNIDREAQKTGLMPEDVAALAELAEGMQGVRLRGLMCIPRYCEDAAEMAASFAAMRQMYEELRARGHDLDTLSMGMSGDLETAIANGSTMVRVGTDLFGPRPQ